MDWVTISDKFAVLLSCVSETLSVFYFKDSADRSWKCPVSPFFDWGRTYKFVVFLSFFLAFHESLSLINWFCHFINRFPNKWWSTQCLFVKKKVEIPLTLTHTHTHLSYSVRDRSRFGLSKFISCKKSTCSNICTRSTISDQWSATRNRWSIFRSLSGPLDQIWDRERRFFPFVILRKEINRFSFVSFRLGSFVFFLVLEKFDAFN